MMPGAAFETAKTAAAAISSGWTIRFWRFGLDLPLGLGFAGLLVLEVREPAVEHAGRTR